MEKVEQKQSIPKKILKKHDRFEKIILTIAEAAGGTIKNKQGGGINELK